MVLLSCDDYRDVIFGDYNISQINLILWGIYYIWKEQNKTKNFEYFLLLYIFYFNFHITLCKKNSSIQE